MGYKHNPESHLNVQHDLYDETIFSKLILQGGLLKDAEDEIEHELITGPALVQDLFHALYKYSVDLKEPKKVDPEYLLNRTILLLIAGSPQWKLIKTQTKGDQLNAASVTATTIKQLILNNQDLLGELRTHLKQLRNLQQNVEILKQNVQTNINQLKTPGSIPQKQKNAITKQLKTYYSKLKNQSQVKKQYNGNIQNLAKTFTMGNILKQAQDLLEFQEHLFGWGDEEGYLRPKDPKESLQIQKILIKKPNIMKIAQLAGKFHSLLCLKQRQKVYYMQEEITDIHQSNEINRMIPNEFINLAIPELMPIFYQRLTNQSLLTYELSGMDSKGEGPIVICIDISGSMGGDRDTWAKAVAIALIQLAKKDSRDAIVIPFDSSVHKSFDFPSDNFQLKTLVQMAGYFTGGGTNFDPPITEAMDYIQKKDRFKDADIIFISDGDGQLSIELKEEFKTFKDASNCSMYSIIIGEEFDFIHHSLKELSNLFLPVKELTEEVAGDLFEAI